MSGCSNKCILFSPNRLYRSVDVLDNVLDVAMSYHRNQTMANIVRCAKTVDHSRLYILLSIH